METLCKVLIVDDEMLVRQGIRHLLDWESEGFHIVGEAANGKDALDMVKEFQPNMILTDIVMPVMNGEELVRVVKGLYPEIEIVVLSSYGEFEYVRSTFQNGVADYLLKPKLDANSLLAVLKKTVQHMPAFRHMDFTNDKGQSVDYVLDKLISGYAMDVDGEEISTYFPYPCFILLVADIQDSPSSLKRNEEWIESFLKGRVQGAQQPVVIHHLSHQDSHIRFLLNTEDTGRADAIHLAEQLVESGVSGGLSFYVALSKNFSKIEELHDVYSNDSLKVLDHRFFLSDVQLFFANELVDDEGNKDTFDSEAFTAELNHQEFQLAFERLNRYVDSMPGRLDIDMFEFKSFLGHSLFNIIVSLLHFHYEASTLDEAKYEYFRAIHEAKHIGEVRSLLAKFLIEAADCVTGNKTNSPGIQKILMYLDEHFAEPLTLTDVAKQFHFNPSYLSNYFTVHNKEGFNEYLNRIRIERACELLRGSAHLSISEISSLVGYSDHSYFTKVFRKLMGTSPSHYRKK
ncbi:response regulator transcription factor [Paenibacillus qinlingensis]|uniref:response regulator transcription factor n=1 Tax=Paenibacillus qinlingensis TaxID=1837343 RepID=UPI0015635599|nr:response regulator transcription factor [Paenibacillus qinlingensis]NQX59756.1 response regulator transcription factor [Paenibacillus qinlingensis]